MTRYERFNEMTFEAYCKKAIDNAIKKEQQKKAARGKLEQSLSTLTDADLYPLSKRDVSIDQAEEPCHIFRVGAMNFPVYDERLSFALSYLMPKDREIVLLYFFKKLRDADVAPLVHMSRSTVARRRNTAIEQLRNLMENSA